MCHLTHGIGATIRTSEDIKCLLYAGFFLIQSESQHVRIMFPPHAISFEDLLPSTSLPPFFLYLFYMLSAHANRVSVSRMRDFQRIGP